MIDSNCYKYNNPNIIMISAGVFGYMGLETWLLVVAIVVLLWVYGRWQHNYWASLGVLTPPTVIFIGHLHSFVFGQRWLYLDKVNCLRNLFIKDEKGSFRSPTHIFCFHKRMHNFLGEKDIALEKIYAHFFYFPFLSFVNY